MDYNIGEGIRKHRKIHGLTQEQLAEIVGVSKSTFANYENNKSVPSIDTIVKIASIFGVTTDDLMNVDKIYSPNTNCDLSVNGINLDTNSEE